MNKYIIAVVTGLITLTAQAQSILIFNSNTDEEETKYVYASKATLSFWGQPMGDEKNGDLTIQVADVWGHSAEMELHVAGGSLLDDFGFHISESEEKEQGGFTQVTNFYRDLSYKRSGVFYSFKRFSEESDYKFKIYGLESEKTYYVTPYFVKGDTLYGTTKTFTTLLSLSKLLSDTETFGTWYSQVDLSNAHPVLPTAKAWEAYCLKYKNIFGEVPSESIKKALVTEWFRHLSSAEVELMKAHTVAYYDEVDPIACAHVVDKVCDDLVPNLLKATADVDITQADSTLDERGKLVYTKNAREIISVACETSWNIEGNSYVKAIPSSGSVNPVVGYKIPFMLLPNRIYNVSITIAPNTEDLEDVRPNRFYVYLHDDDDSEFMRFTNPDLTGEHGEGDYFEYGGGKVETFTIQIDTKGENMPVSRVLQLQSQITSRLTKTYSRELRIAKISISPVMEEVTQGDVDMDGNVNADDIQLAATSVLLADNQMKDESVVVPVIDFTGDGKTLVDDVVALVNYSQNGEFIPAASKSRAASDASSVPSFAVAENLVVEVGESAPISIKMDGLGSFTAFAFDVKVPEGLRIALDTDGRPQVSLGDVSSAQHQLAVAQQEGNIIRVICYANDNANFIKDSGAVVTMSLTADDDTAPNENEQITLMNGMITKPNLKSVMLDDYIINMGIVNGIEEIEDTTKSAISVVSYSSVGGVLLPNLQKGVNLIKMSDGSIKKILVK